MPLWRRLFIWLVFAVSSAGQAAAQPVLNIGFQSDYPPHSYMDGGVARGIDVALLSEAALRAGFQPRVHVIAIQRVLHQLQAGELDLGSVMLLPNSPFGKSAKDTVVFDRPYARSKFYIYAPAQRPVVLTALPDMLKHRLAQHQVALFYNHPDFPNTRPVTFFRNYSILLSALQRDRVDLAVADEISASYALQQNAEFDDLQLESVFYVDKAEFTLVASSLALADEADRVSMAIFEALQTMKRDGRVRRILQEYGLTHMEDSYLADEEAEF